MSHTSGRSVPPSVGAATNIAGANAGLLIKTGPGTLLTVVLNTLAASGVVTLYDGVSTGGTKIATITSPATLLTEGPLDAWYGSLFVVGLFVVTVGAAQDITVVYQ